RTQRQHKHHAKTDWSRVPMAPQRPVKRASGATNSTSALNRNTASFHTPTHAPPSHAPPSEKKRATLNHQYSNPAAEQESHSSNQILNHEDTKITKPSSMDRLR